MPKPTEVTEDAFVRYGDSAAESDFEALSYWKRCYPRIYDSIGAFTSPKHLSYDLASTFWDYEAITRNPGAEPTTNPAIAADAAFHASRLVNFQVPVFFVARELLEALWKTTPPDLIDWRSVQLPFESAAFVMPRDSANIPGYGAVPFLWYSRASKGHTVTVAAPTGHQLTLADDQFYIRTVLRDQPDKPIIIQLYTSSQPTIDLSTAFEDDVLEGSAAVTQAEKALGPSMAGLVFNLLLSMGARPDLVTHGSSKGKRTKRGSEFWTPNIIGRDYTIPRSGLAGTPTGITQRMHWRRGHWRNQAHGTGRQQHRHIWIEPTLVAAQ